MIPRVFLNGPGLFDAAVQIYRLAEAEADGELLVETLFLAAPRFEGMVNLLGVDPLYATVRALRAAPLLGPLAWQVVDRTDRAMVLHHCRVHAAALDHLLLQVEVEGAAVAPGVGDGD